MCNVQIAHTVKYHVTSVANFAKWGGSTQHVLQTGHAGVAKQGGGPYLYVHIYIYTYVQIKFVQVIWDRRSRGQG